MYYLGIEIFLSTCRRERHTPHMVTNVIFVLIGRGALSTPTNSRRNRSIAKHCSFIIHVNRTSGLIVFTKVHDHSEFTMTKFSFSDSDVIN